MELFDAPPLPLLYVEPSGLKPLPPPRGECLRKLDVAWLGDDGSNVFIEVQGSLACVAFRQGPLSYRPSPREQVKGFSAAARLRLFKLTNRLDFTHAGRSTFVTATWRDELGRPDPKEITRARSAFQKAIERMAGCELPGIWRVEWEVRQRGRFRGKYMPHIHSLYFKIPYLPIKAVENVWARSIGWAKEVSLKMNEIDSFRKCLNYVSKYIAKLDVMCRLDIPSYLAKHQAGRKWGVYRKSLLPFAEKLSLRVAPGPLIDRIREIATCAYAKTPQEQEDGFCVFGDAAKEISKIIREWELTHVAGLVS
jgi:hypothetical protein